jgi:glyoxylase-like metal-dependent hydrolase (beta-lactamase superfamily II)
MTMSRHRHAIVRRALVALALAGLTQVPATPAQPAAPPAPPTFETTKVEGTDHVYVFRYQNRQAMFVVTTDGVIATDPIGYGRPQAVTTYLEEIKKVTPQPIKYLIYSHHHYDHIAGGQPFKDAGATVIAHTRAKARLAALQDPATVLPDETVDTSRTIQLGQTTLELRYVGLNHSDSSLVMRLPTEKILFAVDFIPVASVPGRAMIDSYPLEWEASLTEVLAMDWERLIPGHPAPGGRLGTKQDAQNVLTFLQEASAAVKAAAREGKCWEPAEKELTLPKYESWAGYAEGLPFVLRRYCGLWGRGT